MLYCTHVAAQGGIVINELMQSNVDFLIVDHDFPDSWVELYNGGSSNLQIGKYRIGATNVFADAQQLSSSSINLESGQHLLLYCDKTTGKARHYNFNLEASEGSLYLFNSKGQIVDSICYPKMPAPNIAMGRITDGGNDWQYELTPTPGQPNTGTGSSEVLPPPLFSVEGHLMTNGPETLTITMPEGVPTDTRIYLTTDGSEPTWESDRATHFTINIDRSIVVRAKLLSSQMLPSRSTTHSYIFHPRATDLPIVSIATDSIYLFSFEKGIFSDYITKGKPNFYYNWRRPANFEYFNTQDGTTLFNQCGEMAVGGVLSREMPQKSIKCYAKNRFGKKKFKGQLWHDKPQVNSVKSFMLRNGGNNCNAARIYDAVVQRFFGTNLHDIDWQAYEPAIVYINGTYMGIFELRERSNENYVESNYDIDADDVEIATSRNYKRSIESTPYFNDLYSLYRRSDATYDELASSINIDNFMNAFIAECYGSNTDFPQNNVSMWREKGEGHKWKWILKDMDFVSAHRASWNMFNYMLGTDNVSDEEYELANDTTVIKSRQLYEKMMSFPEFRNSFIARYATYLGDFLRPDAALPIVSQMFEDVHDEIAPTLYIYDLLEMEDYLNYVKKFKTYISDRPAYVYRQMADYFSLGDVIPLKIASEEDGDTITICNTPLSTRQFDGSWFTAFPLSLKSSNDDACWIMSFQNADGECATHVYEGAEIQPDLSQYAPGDCVTFTATKAKDTDPSAVNNSRSIDAIYDLAGRRVSQKRHGLNIYRYSDGSRRKVVHR
ncbi:MAG: CotH kinase family protein [Bacteroidaceae bacterium]|nr:CotH kinase family protein [Bacteroidaceae bacterium]